MDLQYTPEQHQLRESVERFVREAYDFSHRRRVAASELGHDADCWRRYADFGWLAIPFSEAEGGIGGDAVDTGIVMEGVGRGLLLEPYLASVVLGGGLLSLIGSETQKAEWLQPMMAGELRLALAYAEPGSRYDPFHIAATARQEGGVWRLDGTKALVYGGDCAEALVVIARSAGAPGERSGLQAFVVDADAPGLSRTAYAMHDGQRAADLRLDGVTVDASRRLVPADGTEVGDALERVVDHGIAALAAEAVGALAVLVDTTLDYLKTRQQFGRPIGTNQALQHRMVDMTIALDEARSMALYAALMLREADVPARRRALSAAKMEIDRTARLVGQEAVQMHGAMGVTEELAVGHYFKRLSMIRLGFGDADWHAERYMAQ